MPLPPGELLHDRYRIVALLGAGGFGAVYRALDITMNHACAVKENGDTSPEAQRQFLREAQILFKLRHPNLPVVYDTFLVPNQGQYLVMDFVEGEDLEALIARGPIAEAQALTWIDQVLAALAYLHSQEPPIIHRDVKPANVRITPEGRAVLVDFGLAKVYDPQLKTTLGARAVTPGYAPIEQYGQGHTDARTDVYAAGATLYAALTGEDPAEATDRLSGAKPLIPPRQLNPDISSYVAAAIEKALENRAADRFADAANFRQALHAPSPAPPAAPPPAEPTATPRHQLAPDLTPSSAPSPRRRRLPRWLLPLAAVLLAVAILLAVYLLGNNDGGTAAQAESTPRPTLAAAAPTTAVEATAPAGVPATSSPAATAAGEAPVVPPGAELLIWADGASFDALQQLAAPFAQDHGVALRIEPYDQQAIREQLPAAARAGNGPDIFVAAAEGLQALVAEDLVASFDLGDKGSAFFPPALDAFVYEGGLYGLPYLMENVAFVYNPTMVPGPPQTWEEVRVIAAELEAAGVVPHGFALTQYDPYHFFPIFSAFGGYLFARADGGFYDTGDVGLDNEGSIAAAHWLATMVAEGHLQPDLTWEEVHRQFESGETAMMITGPWALSRLRASGIPYAIAPFPAAARPGSPLVGAQGFLISAHSENRELAITFLTEYATNDAIMQQIAAATERPSPFLPVLRRAADPDLLAFANAAQNGVPIPPLIVMEPAWNAWSHALELVITGSATPQDALSAAAADVRAATGR